VHEDVSGVQAEDGRFGDAGVGAADPDYSSSRLATLLSKNPFLLLEGSEGIGLREGREGMGGTYGSLAIGHLRASRRDPGFDAICSSPMTHWTSGRIRSRLYLRFQCMD
jgi:hypothetical protein